MVVCSTFGWFNNSVGQKKSTLFENTRLRYTPRKMYHAKKMLNIGYKFASWKIVCEAPFSPGCLGENVQARLFAIIAVDAE